MTQHAEAVRIIKAVSEHFDISVSRLLSNRREQPTVLYRQVAMYLCRLRTDLTLIEVGKLFGRHHSTIIHAERRVLDTAPGTLLAHDINILLTRLHAREDPLL